MTTIIGHIGHRRFTVPSAVLLLFSMLLLGGCATNAEFSKENTVVDFKYGSIVALPNHLLLGKNKDGYSGADTIMNGDGKIIYESNGAEIEGTPIFSQGKYYYTVKKGGKKGLIDENGSEVFPVIFNDGMNETVNFSDFLASAGKIAPFAKTAGSGNDRKTLWGYMDKTTGNVVIPPKYYGAYPFHNGIAKVTVTSNSSFTADWGAKNYVAMEDTDIMYLFINEQGSVIGQAPGKNMAMNSDNGYLPEVAKREVGKSYSSLFDKMMSYEMVTYVFKD